MVAPRKNDRANAMYALYQQGFSLQDVGTAFGVSRQTVYKIFKTRDFPLRKKKVLPFVIFNGDQYTVHRRYYRKTDGNKERLHRAIWRFHHGKIPLGCHVHHRNGDCLDNRIQNLELIDPVSHSLYHARTNKGFHSTQFKPTKISVEAINQIREDRRNGIPVSQIATNYGVCESYIYRILRS